MPRPVGKGPPWLGGIHLCSGPAWIQTCDAKGLQEDQSPMLRSPVARIEVAGSEAVFPAPCLVAGFVFLLLNQQGLVTLGHLAILTVGLCF